MLNNQEKKRLEEMYFKRRFQEYGVIGLSPNILLKDSYSGRKKY